MRLCLRALSGQGPLANAQLPPNFLPIRATTYFTNAGSPGYIFANVGNYVMILNNDGTRVRFQAMVLSCYVHQHYP